MSPRLGRAVESVAIVVIAVAVLIGGRSLLVEVARWHALAAGLLAVLTAVELLALLRNYRAGGPLARIRASRDVAFVAATVAAFCFTLAPARWSLGASIAALEFALVLELLGRFAPASPQA